MLQIQREDSRGGGMKKYFTMFSNIMYGDPSKSVMHCKLVARCDTEGMAKRLAGILNRGIQCKPVNRPDARATMSNKTLASFYQVAE